jgi:hypothetical protein
MDRTACNLARRGVECEAVHKGNNADSDTVVVRERTLSHWEGGVLCWLALHNAVEEDGVDESCGSCGSTCQARNAMNAEGKDSGRIG